jgi:uncharacterized oligopeptide transporter (OPT) family protein
LGAVYFGKPFVDKLISDTSTPFTLIVGAAVSIIALGVIIYLSYKIDWAKVIGRWFPWTVDKSDGNNE